MRIVSWNVNGLRSVCQKGFSSWLMQSQADIVGLQECKLSSVEQVPAEIQALSDWHTYYALAEQKGYSGTGLLCRKAPQQYIHLLGVPALDREGRFQHLDVGDFVVLNIYFPKGSGTERDNSRVPYKLSFYERVFAHIQELRSRGREVVIMGDYNTAHREIDLKNWKGNVKSSGFLPEERAVLDVWIKSGLVDTFRHVHGDQADVYTWWSPWAGARARNVGWRVDYVFVTPGLAKKLIDAFVWPHVLGSDHCPVGIDLK